MKNIDNKLNVDIFGHFPTLCVRAELKYI